MLFWIFIRKSIDVIRKKKSDRSKDKKKLGRPPGGKRSNPIYMQASGLVPKALYAQAKDFLDQENREVSDLFEQSLRFYVALREREIIQDNGDLDHTIDNAIVLLEFLRSLKSNNLVDNDADLVGVLSQIIADIVSFRRNSQSLDNTGL